MTETPETVQASEAPPSVGARLLQARQSQGLSLGEMARQLKLSVKQVDALERDDYTRFPGTLWVRGFLRNYAKSLGLDANAIIESAGLAGEAPGAVPTVAGTPMPAEATKERRRTLLLTIAFVVLGLFVLALLGQRASRTDDQPVSALTPPIVQSSPPSNSAATTAGVITNPPADPAIVAPSSAATPATTAEMPVPSAVQVPPAFATVPVDSAATPTVPDSTSAQPVSAAPATTAGAAPPATSSLSATPVMPASATGSAPAPSTSATPAASSTAVPATPMTTAGGATAAEPVEPPKPRTLRFTFTQSVNVEVKDADGKVLLAKLQAAGSEKAVRGLPPFTVTVGNVHAVSLVYRGRAVDLTAKGKSGAAKITLK